MPQGLVPSSNAILVAGTPLVEELEVETVTNLYPGCFVIRDTSDERIEVAGAAAKNVLGIADVIPGKTRATIFEAGDQVRILRGSCVVMAKGVANQSFTKGDALITAAGGLVTAAATIAVAYDAGANTVGTDPVESGSIPPGGEIVGYAAETKTDTGTFWVMIYLAI